MCRSLAQGGRRCCGGGYDARRAYQRDWLRAKRERARLGIPVQSATALLADPHAEARISAALVAVEAHWDTYDAARRAMTPEQMRQGFWPQHEALTIAAGQAILDKVGPLPVTSPDLETAMDRVIRSAEAISFWQDEMNYLRRDSPLPAEQWLSSVRDKEEELRNLNAEHKAAVSAYYKQRDKVFAVHRAAILRELGNVCDFGDSSVAADPRSHKGTVKLADEVSRLFPDELLDASNEFEAPVLFVKGDKGGRAHYKSDAVHQFKEKFDEQVASRDDVPGSLWSALVQDGDGRLVLPDTPENDELLERVNATAEKLSQHKKGRSWSARRNADGTLQASGVRMAYHVVPEITNCRGDEAGLAHEISHRLEYRNAAIGEVCRAFRSRRSTGRVIALDTGESALEGSFAHPYMGRVYDHLDGTTGATEVFSTGVEAVFYGEFGGLLGREEFAADPEHRALVVGLLATASAVDYQEHLGRTP